MKRKILIGCMLVVTIGISGAVLLHRQPMSADSLVAFKAQLLREFILKDQGRIGTNRIVFLAFGHKESGWIDPPAVVTDGLASETRFRLLPGSSVPQHKSDGPFYSVYYVTTEWNQEAKAYACKIGRYDGSYDPEILCLSGHGESGEIRGSWFKWRVYFDGFWVS